MYHVSYEGSETEKYCDLWFVVKMTPTAAGQQLIGYHQSATSDKINTNEHRTLTASVRTSYPLLNEY